MKRMLRTAAVLLTAVIVFSAVSGGNGLSLKAYAGNGNSMTEPGGTVRTAPLTTTPSSGHCRTGSPAVPDSSDIWGQVRYIILIDGDALCSVNQRA